MTSRKRPLKEAKFLLVTLFFLFSFFLIFYISSDFILVQTYSTYTIASTPKMVTKVGSLFESRKAFKEFYRCLSFSIPLTSDINNLGGIENIICIYSSFTFIPSISILLHSHSILRLLLYKFSHYTFYYFVSIRLDTRRYDIYIDRLYEIIFSVCPYLIFNIYIGFYDKTLSHYHLQRKYFF